MGFLQLFIVISLYISSFASGDELLCKKGEFSCSQGGCVDSSLRCDGYEDCPDGSDELHCFVKSNPCKSHEMFPCANGKCISVKYKCDGSNDCGDGSDEQKCHLMPDAPHNITCPHDQFLCDDFCLPNKFRCDGHEDCDDNADEEDCYSMKHDCHGHFCSTMCLAKNQMCDGVEQCPDGSDEANCGPEPSMCLLEGGFFLCPGTKRCLHLAQTCDSRADCPRAEDESDLCGHVCSSRTPPCSHQCAISPLGPHCLCPTGYRLDRDNTSCINIDECMLQPPVCSQKCVDLPGNYSCTCELGYVLQGQHSCIANSTEGVLLLSSPPQIHRYGIHTQHYERQENLPPLNILTMDFDHIGGLIYWVNAESDDGSVVALYRSRLRSPEVETIMHPDFHGIRALAVDWVGRHLYLTYIRPGRIVVCDLHGHMCTVLIHNLEQPEAIVIDPLDKLMFWIEAGTRSYIGKAGMDGFNPHPFVHEFIAHPVGLTLDRPGMRLYWSDASFNHIEVIDFDGRNRRVLPVYINHLTSLDVFEDWLFWTDQGIQEVGRCDKLTGHNHTAVIRLVHTKPVAVKVQHSLKQPFVDSPCLDANCSHICVLSPVMPYRCLCPMGMDLMRDGHTCQDSYATPWLVINRGSKFLQIHPDRLGRTSVKPIYLKASRRVGAVAYHPALNSLVYSDLASRTIFAFNMATHGESVLWNRSIDAVEGIVVDPLSGLTYWTDAGHEVVECGDPIEKTRVVLTYEIHHPTSLAVAFSKGIAFVVENGFVSQQHGTLFRVVRLNLADLTVRPFVPMVSGPGTVLTYDHVTDYLYWSDPNQGTIERARWDETDHSIVRSHLGIPNCLTLMGPTLFWAERLQSTHLQAINTLTMQPERPLHLGAPSKDDLRHLTLVFKPEIKDLSYACGLTNGGCDQICLPTGTGRRCLCEVGFSVVNETKCVRRANCLENEWQCSTGICISIRDKCDGIQDCLPNGEDEKDCTILAREVHCGPRQFKCQDNTCIQDTFECDGEFDCRDNSDEHEHCPKPICDSKTELMCANGKHCYFITQHCDDFEDCTDGSDEANCPVKCTDEQYRCEGNATKCIGPSWICDGFSDCPMDDDESQCNGTLTTKVAVTCPVGQSACDGGYCLPDDFFCDGEIHCPDGSDEDYCDESHPSTSKPIVEHTCPKDTFMCARSSGRCIPQSSKCDCVQDCEGGEDESDCMDECGSWYKCPEDERVKIPRAHVCDGEEDCPEGSEESFCVGRSSVGDHRETEIVENRTMDCGDRFACKSGECIDWFLVCDKETHCVDTTDEGMLCDTACMNPTACLKHQTCQPSPFGPVCSCNAGYRMVDNNCEDINECEEDNPCSHQCENVKGGYKCSCAAGYSLGLDKKSCKLDGEKPRLVLATSSDVQFTTFTSADVFQVLARLTKTQVEAMDFNTRTQALVYTTNKGEIYRVTLQQPNTWTKPEYLGSIPGRYLSTVAWNWNADYVYLVSSNSTEETSDIMVWSFALQQAYLLVRRQGLVTDLAVDPMQNSLIWTESYYGAGSQAQGAIVRSYLNASNAVVLDKHKIFHPMALTLDTIKKNIYWADLHLRRIEVIGYDGQNRHVIVAATDGAPVSLTFFSDTIVWLCFAQDHVHSISVTNSSETREIRTGEPLRVIRVMHPTLQPISDFDPCRGSQCSHLCLPHENQFSCHCPSHMVLAGNRRLCVTSTEHSKHGTKAHRVNHADVDITDGTGVTVLSVVVCLGVVTALAIAGYFYFKKCKREVGSPFKLRLRMSPSAPEESVTWEDSVDFTDRGILHRKEALKLEKEKPAPPKTEEVRDRAPTDVRNRSISGMNPVQLSPVAFSMRDKLISGQV